MSATTGPVLAAATVRALTDSYEVGDLAISFQLIASAVVASVALSLAERAWPAGAKALSWSLLVATLFVRPPGRHAPVEVLLDRLNAISVPDKRA